MNRCFCKDWEKGSERIKSNAESFRHWHPGGYYFCPWCGKPLAESKSQQNRLKMQLMGEDANKKNA